MRGARGVGKVWGRCGEWGRGEVEEAEGGEEEEEDKMG